MLTSPVELFPRAQELKEAGQSFVMATVIRVRGSTSAKIGSKAIFDEKGINLYGYVGGGCAEAHVAQEACAALQDRWPRIIEVDLDDELFGLMPCGGVMEIYLEPHFPALSIQLPNLLSWNSKAKQLLQELGFITQVDLANEWFIQNRVELFACLAFYLAKFKGFTLHSLRDSKGFGPRPRPILPERPESLILVGQTRITEEFCRLAMILEWNPTIYLAHLDQHNMPVQAKVCELPLQLTQLSIPRDSWVVIASHHRQDATIAGHALAQGAAYVSLVASEKRSNLITADLFEQGLTLQSIDRFFAPAGLNMPTDTPTQIAFSMICEILACIQPELFGFK